MGQWDSDERQHAGLQQPAWFWPCRQLNEQERVVQLSVELACAYLCYSDRHREPIWRELGFHACDVATTACRASSRILSYS